MAVLFAVATAPHAPAWEGIELKRDANGAKMIGGIVVRGGDRPTFNDDPGGLTRGLAGRRLDSVSRLSHVEPI